MKTLFQIIGYLDRSERIRFFGVVFAFVLTSLVEAFTLMLLVPYIGIVSQDPKMIDRFTGLLGVSYTNRQLFIGFSIFFCVMMVLKSLLQLNSNHQLTKYPYQFYQERTSRLFERYLTQDYSQFVNQETGTMVKHCNQTSFYATQAVYQQLLILSYFIITTFLFTAILVQDFLGSLSLIALFGVISWSIFVLNKKPVKKMGNELIEYTKQAYHCVLESFHLFKEAKLYRKTDLFTEKFRHYLIKIANNYRRKEFLSYLPTVFVELVAVLLLIAILTYAYLTDGITAQFTAALIFYAAVGRRILPSINQLIYQAINLQHSLESLETIEKELDQFSQPSARKKTSALDFHESVEFRDVCFSYEQDRLVLDRVCFKIPKNRSVAFVGPSGGGKSTIIDMLIGLIHPDSGAICVDGKTCQDLVPLQHLIGYVPQSIALINDTIARNIALGDHDIDKKRIEEVLVASHLKEFVDSLPNGAQTVVGDKGIKISGGQMQRIGIARALYQQPEIIVFDEATSSLDHLSELVISQSMREMMGQKTVVAVAHRLSTVSHFDCIYVLDQGRVIASGTHEELMQTCSLYQSLNQAKICVG